MDNLVAWNSVGSTTGRGGGIGTSSTAAVNLSRLLCGGSTFGGLGGGVSLLDQSSIATYNSSIAFNKAQSGGRVLLGFNAHWHATVAQWHATVANVPSLLAAVYNNSAKYGLDVGVDPTNKTFVGNVSEQSYISRASAEAGALVLRLAVVGRYRLPAPGLLATATLEGSQIGANMPDASGIVHLLVRIQKPPGLYIISVGLSGVGSVLPANITLHVRGCIPGEVAPMGWPSLTRARHVCLAFTAWSPRAQPATCALMVPSALAEQWCGRFLAGGRAQQHPLNCTGKRHGVEQTNKP
jgi:hypothetical protein